MSWFSKEDPISKIVGEVGDVIDDLHTSDEERALLKLKLEDTITKRWEADMRSDSWLPKNIRPLSLVYLMGLLTVFAFADGNIGTFTINPAYVELFKALAITAFGGYFAARTLDKFAKVKYDKE